MESARLHLGMAGLVLAAFAFALPLRAQDPSPLVRLEALGLDTMQVGRVTAYFAPSDRGRAEQIASLSEAAAAYFEQELGIAFDLRVAALAPEHWFSEYPDIPYAIPWASVPERLVFVPSSLEEGLLVEGLDDVEGRRRTVDFVLLHEYGHVAAKAYFRADSDQENLPVSWFEEFLANYFAYAYVRASDVEWSAASKAAWRNEVERFTPSVLSLDWSFMYELPPDELARTYGWYQYLLNLRAAEVYEEHGLALLRTLVEHLAWEEAGDWTTESLLASLEGAAPGFTAWADGLQRGEY